MHRVHGLYEDQTIGLDVLDENQQQLQRGFYDQPEPGREQRVQPLDGGIILNDAVHPVNVQHDLAES